MDSNLDEQPIVWAGIRMQHRMPDHPVVHWMGGGDGEDGEDRQQQDGDDEHLGDDCDGDVHEIHAAGAREHDAY